MLERKGESDKRKEELVGDDKEKGGKRKER